MKKGILIVLLSLVLLSGCGDKKEEKTSDDSKSKVLTCTKTETDEDGYKTSEILEVTHKDNKVLKVKETSESETDPSMIDFVYNFGNVFISAFNNVEGIKATYTKEGDNVIKTIMEVDYTKLDVDALKDALGDSYIEEDAALFNKKDINLDEFKSSQLDEYECK